MQAERGKSTMMPLILSLSLLLICCQSIGEGGGSEVWQLQRRAGDWAGLR